MKVFIENESGSNQKNIFDEKSLQYKKTYTVSRPYPFPYGFVINTTSGDGDNLDCFVLTDKPLKSTDLIDVEPIGMFEQEEDGKQDHKILAVLSGDKGVVNEKIKTLLKDFIENVFTHKPNKTMVVGRFLGLEDTQKLIKDSEDPPK